MNRKYLLMLISTVLFVAVTSCGQKKHKSRNTKSNITPVSATNDSIAVETVFEALKQDENFQQSLAMEYEDQFNGEGHPHRLIFGDINGDGLTDALLRFTVEGRGGGNNWDLHYAVFLNRENQWKYSTQLDASIFAEDRFLEILKIENAVAKGNWVGKSDESLTPYAAEYILKDDQIINTFTALHQKESAEKEYLYIETVLTPEHTAIPLTANLKIYEQFLGKGKIVTPEEQPECGTYLDEETIRHLDYPNLQFELNDQNEAVLISLKLKTGFRLQTDKGTINTHTTLENLKSVFQKNDDYMIMDEEKNFTIFAIPDGVQSDNQWRFTFDNNGKLKSVSLFIPC